jgi:N utilization substance protein B
MSRRRARELALRILYWHEQGNGKIEDIMDQVLSGRKYSADNKTFTSTLVKTTIDNLATIDRAIVKVLKNWKFDRVSLIDKLILRIGVCEIQYIPDIPHEVAINEAIEISKRYGDEDSPKFVNGILDAIASAAKNDRKAKDE